MTDNPKYIIMTASSLHPLGAYLRKAAKLPYTYMPFYYESMVNSAVLDRFAVHNMRSRIIVVVHHSAERFDPDAFAYIDIPLVNSPINYGGIPTYTLSYSEEDGLGIRVPENVPNWFLSGLPKMKERVADAIYKFAQVALFTPVHIQPSVYLTGQYVGDELKAFSLPVAKHGKQVEAIKKDKARPTLEDLRKAQGGKR